MNKPNNQKPAPFAVFGTKENGVADKAIVGFKSPHIDGYEVHICEVETNSKIGDHGVLKDDSITGEYFVMYFCNRNSLRAMIKVLQNIDDKWVAEKLGEALGNTDDATRQAMETLYKNLTPVAQEDLLRVLQADKEKANDKESE